MVEYSFQKAKLGKGLSYPLKRTVLDRLIDEAMIEQLGWVYYRRIGVPTYVLSAYRFGDSSKGAVVHLGLCDDVSTVRQFIELAGLYGMI